MPRSFKQRLMKSESTLRYRPAGRHGPRGELPWNGIQAHDWRSWK